MSHIGTEEVRRLAALAHIRLTEEEISRFSVELGNIVGMVERLKGVDVGSLPPTNQVTGLVDAWREDKPSAQALSREQALANAPATQDGYIKVRRVLD